MAQNLKLKKSWLVTLWSSWVALLATVTFAVCQYEFTPGKVGSVPTYFKNNLVNTELRKNFPTLLVSLHPKCSCSQATLAELTELLADSAVKANVVALITAPTSAAVNWKKDIEALSQKVRSNLAGQVLIDKDAKEAKNFGMLTSGHVLLYSQDGALLYNGGVTIARGQRGKGPSIEALRKIVTANSQQYLAEKDKPVFGCELTDA